MFVWSSRLRHTMSSNCSDIRSQKVPSDDALVQSGANSKVVGDPSSTISSTFPWWIFFSGFGSLSYTLRITTVDTSPHPTCCVSYNKLWMSLMRCADSFLPILWVTSNCFRIRIRISWSRLVAKEIFRQISCSSWSQTWSNNFCRERIL